MKIEELLTQPEGKTLEFKQDLSSPKNILKTLTAFANTAGGVVLIGIEDGTRAIIGVENPLDEEEKLCNLIADSIEPRLVPNVELVHWKGRIVLVAEVYPSPLRPHWIKSQGMENAVLVRVGSTNRQADGPLIAELRRSALSRSFDEEPMPEINPEVLDFRVASGLLEPVLEEQAFSFRVTISLKRVMEYPKKDAADQKIIELLRARETDGGASTQDLSHALGMTPRSIRTRIARLLSAGKIVAVGKSAFDPKKRYLPANGE